MPDYVKDENAESSLEGTDEVKQLESVIKMYDEDIEQISAQIENLEKQINEKKAELEKNLNKEDSLPKILTKKQLKKLMEERELAKEKRLLDLKNNIDAITKAEFEKAKVLRVQAQESSVDQKNSLESKALGVEISALEKERKVKNAILYEKQEKSQDILADKISEELKIEKLRKKLVKLQILKQDNGIVGKDIRNRMNVAIANKNRLIHDYERLVKEIHEIGLKLDRSGKILKSKLGEAENIKS